MTWQLLTKVVGLTQSILKHWPAVFSMCEIAEARYPVIVNLHILHVL